MTGEFSADRFRSQYGFLNEMHQGELGTLKENLKKARKQLASSPRNLREEREQEVQRLERAVKRAESTVNKDRMDKIQQSALQKARQEEREKRKDGKKAWYMKEGNNNVVCFHESIAYMATQPTRKSLLCVQSSTPWQNLAGVVRSRKRSRRSKRKSHRKRKRSVLSRQAQQGRNGRRGLTTADQTNEQGLDSQTRLALRVIILQYFVPASRHEIRVLVPFKQHEVPSSYTSVRIRYYTV